MVGFSTGVRFPPPPMQKGIEVPKETFPAFLVVGDLASIDTLRKTTALFLPSRFIPDTAQTRATRVEYGHALLVFVQSKAPVTQPGKQTVELASGQTIQASHSVAVPSQLRDLCMKMAAKPKEKKL